MIDRLIRFMVQLFQRRSELRNAEQITLDTAAGFWALYHYALTFHGRYHLVNVINAANQGDLEVDPKVLGMYRLVLSIAPYQMYAIIN